MDPVGPWSAYTAASYNRLANASGVPGANDYHRQLAAVGVAPGVSHMASGGGTATTSHQLLLQAAHASAASAVTTPSAFNPGRFLSPPPVGYDAVFSPLFHQKNTYNAALNQRHLALKQPGTNNESNVAAADLVTQYGAMHHPTLAAAANALFDHQPATSSPSSSSTSSPSASPYQPAAAHTQLHSPFGILPHESVLTGGGTATSKANGPVAFESTFNPHFTNAQSVNNSHNSSATTSAEFCQDNPAKKLNKPQNSQLNKTTLMSQPPQSVVKSVVSGSLYSTGLHTQQQALPSAVSATKYNCKCGLNCGNLQCCLSQQQRIGANVTTTTSPNNSVIINNYQTVNKACSQQLNNVIVNKNNVNNNDNNNASTKTQVNAAMSVDRRQNSSDSVQKEQCSSGQSSPVCFAMTAMPSVHRTIADFGGNTNNNNNNNNNSNAGMLVKGSPRNVITTAQYNPSHRSVVSPVSYCQNMVTVKTPPMDLLKTAGVSGSQKSADCGVVVPRRPSPLQAHSQTSPLAHVPSPAYPMYNSPVTSINSPTQQTTQTSSIALQCQPQTQNYNNSKQTTPVGGEGSLSPLDVSVQRRSICEPINKNYMSSDCTVRQQNNSNARSWESSIDQDRMNSNNCQKTNNNIVNSSSYDNTGGPQRHIEQQQQQQMYYSCRAIDRSVSVVKQNSCEEKNSPEPCLPSVGTSPSSSVKHKRSYEKNNVSRRDVVNLNVPVSSSSSSPSPLASRVPPPAHNNSGNQQQQNDNYFDYERWNTPSSGKLTGVNSLSESFMENNKHIMSGIYNSNHFINSVAHQTNQSLNLPSANYHPRLSSPLALANSFYHNPHPHPHSHPHPHPSSGLHVSLMNPYSHSNSVSPSNDLQNAPVELASVAVAVTANETSADVNVPCKAVVDENPKVIVPNIEEELDFLVDDNPATSAFAQKQNMAVTPEKVTPSPAKPSNGGFMASYIKFLQGERDTSPPPMGRNTRRTPLTRVRPVSTVTTTSVSNSTTTVTSTTTTTPTTISSSQSQPSNPPLYNPEDDPRYFPLPKTSAHRGNLDSSDDENGEFSYFKNLAKKSEPVNKTESPSSSSSLPNTKPDMVAKPVTETNNKSQISNSNKSPSTKTEKKTKTVESKKRSNSDSSKKPKAAKEKVKVTKDKKKSETVNNETDKKKRTKQSRKRRPQSVDIGRDNDNDEDIKQEDVKSNDADFSPMPQRTVPKRKAKENINSKGLLDDDDDYEYVDNDEEDEDFEPDWMPADDDDDLEHGRGKRKRGRLSVNRRTRSRSINSNQSRRSKRTKSEVDDDDSPLSTRVNTNKIAGQKATTEDGGTQVAKPSDNKSSANLVDKFRLPFSVGEYVVFKNELDEDWPTIWRVHGKSLIQKLEKYEENGETLYKSVSTFSGCTNKIASSLIVVPCRVRLQNKGEFIVELLRRELKMTPEEKNVTETAMKETEKYQDNFEVYIQTLLSQALDSNFLAEIILEKDEYFLINMKAIDDLTEQHKIRLVKAANWENRIVERSLSTWPCYNILYSLSNSEKSKKCESCDLADVSCRVIAYGQPYNIESLEGKTPDPSVVGHKDMLICRECITAVVLYNKIAHQKYLMFVECAKRVGEKRTNSPDKDTTVILNELLADEAWLTHLFKKVRSTWAEVNRFELNTDSTNTNSKT